MAYGLFAPAPRAAPRGLTFDDDYRIRNTNPYTRIFTSPGAGPDTQIAPDFGSLLRATNWEDVNLARSLRPMGGNPLAYLTGGTPSNLMPSNPFTDPAAPQRVVKNPGIQSAVDSILGRVQGLSSDPNVNPNVVRTNVKDPATAARIGSAGQRFDADVNDTRQSFADFVKNFSANLASSQKQLEGESSSLDTVYDTGPGGLEAKLAAMANARRLAVTTSAQRAMAAAAGRTNSARLLGGDSSYLDAQMIDAMGGIGAEAAKEKADLDRLNLLGVVDARSRLLGARGNASMNLAQRGLIPVEAQQRLAGNELAQLAGLSGVQNQNTFYGLDSPDQMLARQLGLLGQTASIDNANNFWRQLYQPDGSGALPIGGVPRSRPQPMYDPFAGDPYYQPPGGGLSGLTGNYDPSKPAGGLRSDPMYGPPMTFRPRTSPGTPDYRNPFEFPELNAAAVQEIRDRFAMRPESFYGPDAYDWRQPTDIY